MDQFYVNMDNCAYTAAKKLYWIRGWKSKAELSPPLNRSCVQKSRYFTLSLNHSGLVIHLFMYHLAMNGSSLCQYGRVSLYCHQDITFDFFLERAKQDFLFHSTNPMSKKVNVLYSL